MEQVDPLSFPAAPLLPSAGHCTAWLLSLAGGLLPEVEARGDTHPNRTDILGPDGSRLTLTVPTGGGWRRLRRLRSASEIASLPLSGHDSGDWRRAHLAAISAAYGRTPYYEALRPALEEAFGGASTFGDLCLRLHRACVGLMLPRRESLPALLRLRAGSPELYAALHAERAASAPADISLLHPLMSLGPEAAIALLPPPICK